MQKSCVHVYTGDGKGKTTASVGIAARAIGQGLRVGFFQFMKSGMSGELVSLAKLGVMVVAPQGSTKFVFQMDEAEKTEYAEKQQATLGRAIEQAGELDLLVLDEIVSAVTTGMIPSAQVEDFLKTRPEGLEVVMTGRDVPEQLIDLCDYVTEMKMHKHPYEKGIPARKGVEF
ncbi:cob(I)yrinic acid a,c-diamide adenosyltransferase [Ruminococcaceae bacterium OttesenSCG-928-D13]|nr:cob(I)yrinic acid a,c-diamide adenosyltransferase [Ruminococcaceae bacterium OttesenSCG-928-D13]